MPCLTASRGGGGRLLHHQPEPLYFRVGAGQVAGLEVERHQETAGVWRERAAGGEGLGQWH
eukprot:8840020-Lingulodinium_polyedra.AAC.1